jgi:hypothetical protein
MKKIWWKSRTLWFNAIASGLLVLESKTDVLQTVLPVDFYTIVAVVLPVVNAALRVITTTGLTTKPLSK